MSEIVTEPPIIFVPKLKAPDGTLHVIEEPHPGWQHAMRQRAHGDRAALLAHLQHDESGVDIPGVVNHLGGLGMALNPYAIVTNSGDREARAALAKHDATLGVSQLGPTPTYSAAYFLGKLGLSVIDRPDSKSTDEINQSVVHEGGHANGLTEVTVVHNEAGKVTDTYMSKRGFKVLDEMGHWQGQLAEESFAILTEGGYNQAVHVQQGKPYAAKPHRMIGLGHIHPKYIHEGGLQHHFALGAVALEVLGAHDPGLAPVILEARQSQDGIDALVARLEAIASGLGRRLVRSRSVGLGRIIPDDGSLLLRHALRATRTSTGDVLDICEEGPMGRHFANAAASDTSGQSSRPEQGEVREHIEVRHMSASDEDEITRVLRDVADTMRGDDNLS